MFIPGFPLDSYFALSFSYVGGCTSLGRVPLEIFNLSAYLSLMCTLPSKDLTITILLSIYFYSIYFSSYPLVFHLCTNICKSPDQRI